MASGRSGSRRMPSSTAGGDLHPCSWTIPPILDFGGELAEQPEQTWKTLNTEYLDTPVTRTPSALISLVQVWTIARGRGRRYSEAPRRRAPLALTVLCDVAGGLGGGTIGVATGAGC